MIQEYLNKIKNAIYGKDVRQAIHDAIHQCYEDGKAGELDLIAREGVEEVKANISNPNLLINGDFQVWQRGEKIENVSPNVYTADRWKNTKLNTQNLTVEKVNGGMKLSTTDSRTVITQYIEKGLLNEDYTISLSVDGVTLSTTFRATDTTWLTKDLYHNGEKLVVVAFQVQNENCTNIEIYIQKQVAVLNWVKLEKGSIATPFTSRLREEELALCERFYQKGTIALVRLFQYTTGELILRGNFLAKMRAIPTATLSNLGVYDSTGTVTTANEITVQSTANDSVVARAIFPNAVNQYCYGAWCWVVLDAEIY